MLDLELLASIASGGLGQWVEGRDGRPVYVKSEDCIGCLKDLQRFFRYDNPEERPTFFAVHKYNLARSDLVPLIVTYPEEYDVVYNALKVATFLSMPSMAEEPTNLAEQAEHIQRVREAFLAQDALAVVVGLLAEPLSRHPRMSEEDIVMTQLVITFLRNLVAAPAPSPSAAISLTGTQDARARIKRGLLERLFADNVMDLLLILAQHANQAPFRSESPVLVETFLHLLQDLEPGQLLDAEAALKVEQEQAAAQQAAAEAAQQQKQRRQQGAGGTGARGGSAGGNAQGRRPAQQPQLTRLGVKLPPRPGQGGMVQVPRALVAGNKAVAQSAPARHSRSDAVFVRRHADHSRNVVLRNNPAKSELPELPSVTDKRQGKAELREGSGRVGQGRLGAALLLHMRGFIEAFLEGGYAILMGQVFREVQPGLGVSRLVQRDFQAFMELAALATRFIRVKEERKLREQQQAGAGGEGAGGQPAAEGGQQQQGREGSPSEDKGEEEASPFTPISATMGWDAFFWTHKMWIHLVEGMAAHSSRSPRPAVEWDLQHAAVPLLKEMLLTLDLARVVGTPADRRAADRLQRRLLHDDLKESGLLPLLGRMIKGYNFRFQPRSHAVDLVECLHVVVGMLDRLSAAEAGGFKVKKNIHPGAGKRRKPPQGAEPQMDNEEENQRPTASGGNQQAEPPQQQAEPQGDVAMADAAASAKAAMAAAGLPAAAVGAAGEAAPAGSPAAGGGSQAAAGAAVDEEQQAEGGGSPAAEKPAAPAPAVASDSAGSPAAAAPKAAAEGAPSPAARSEADCVSIVGTPAGRGGAAGAAGAGATSTPAPLTGRGGRARDPFEEEEEEEGEEDEEERRPRYKEVSLDVNKRLREICAVPVVVHFYSWLLQGYVSNAPLTNHALLRFLQRLADPQGLDLEPMLYQLSTLRLFHAILADTALRRSPAAEPLLHFVTRVVRNLFQRLVPDLAGLHEQLDKLQKEEEAAAAAREDGAEVGESGSASQPGSGGGEGSPDDGERDEAAAKDPAALARKRLELEVELKTRRAVASLGYLEILFWKGALFAENIRDEYNWRKLVDPPEARRHGGRRGSSGGGGDGLGAESDGDDALVGFGFGAGGGSGRAGKGGFSEEQERQLRKAFERVNGHKECLDLLVEEFGGRCKKVHISRQLKAMGLKRGAFTENQESLLRTLYLEHSVATDAFDLIAEELGAGFTAGQVKRHLRKMGLVAPAKGSRKRAAGGGGEQGRRRTNYSALGSDDDSSGDERPPRAGGSGDEMSPELGRAGRLGSDSNDDGAGSDSDGGSASGFESAKSELGDSDDEGLGALQNFTSALEGKKQRGKKHRAAPLEATPDLLAGFSSDEDGEPLALGGGKVQQKQQQQGTLGATQELVPANTPWPARQQKQQQQKRGGKPTVAKKRRAVAAAGTAGNGSDSKAGGSFVTLEDSQGGAAGADADTAAAGGKKRGAAAAKPKPKPRKPSRAAAIGSSSESDGDDGGDGFHSAGEEDPPGAGASSPAAPAAKKQKGAAGGGKGRKGAAAASKRRCEAAAAGSDSSDDDDAPLWSPASKPQKRRASGAAGGGQRASPDGGKENAAGRHQGVGAAAGSGDKGPGRKETAASAKQRAAALEQLRRKKLGLAAGADEAGEGDRGGTPHQLPPHTEPFGGWPASERQPMDTDDSPPLVPAPAAAAKPAGRRLLKKAGGGAPAAPAPMIDLDDLEDF